MRPAHISITDPVRDVAGHYQEESEYTRRPVITLHLETAAGVDLVLHFEDLPALERLQAQVLEAVRQIRQQAEKREKEDTR